MGVANRGGALVIRFQLHNWPSVNPSTISILYSFLLAPSPSSDLQLML